MKKHTLVLIALVIAVVASMLPVGVTAEGAFETNLTGWSAADGTEWTLTENGYENHKYPEDAETGNHKHLAFCDKVADPKKSFTYEVTYKLEGYGAGLAFNVEDRANFFAVEVNCEGKVYFPTVQDGQWSLWEAYAPDMTAEQMQAETHTIKFVYNAKTHGAQVFVDDIKKADIVYVNDSIFDGKIGLYYEDGLVTFTKAVFTEETPTATPDAAATPDPKATATPAAEKFFETNLLNWRSGDTFNWAETTAGFSCVNDYTNKHIALADANITEDTSFKYEVTFTFNGYGCGLALGVTDVDNFAGIEVNTEGKLYFPCIIDGSWSLYYGNGQDLSAEQMSKDHPHTLAIEYDAEDYSALVYYDGEVMQEMVDIDFTLFEGNVGLYNEDTNAYYTKAVLTVVERPTSAPTEVTTKDPNAPTATPKVEATKAPATSTPTKAPADNTSDGTEEGSDSNTVLIVVAAVLAVAIIAVVVVIVIKKKKSV